VKDYGYEAQLAAEKRLEEDEEAWHCTTCIVREVLEAAWPIFEESREPA